MSQGKKLRRPGPFRSGFMGRTFRTARFHLGPAHPSGFPLPQAKAPEQIPRTPPQPTMSTAADDDADYHSSGGSVMPDVLAKGREACYKVQPSPPSPDP